MMRQYFLSEWLADTNVKDIPIHIYTFPLNEKDERHSAGGLISSNLSKINNFQPIIFYEQYIASFHEITEWDKHTFIKHECRVIHPEKELERKLFERLLKKEIINLAIKKDYKIDRSYIRLKKKPEIFGKNELLVFPALFLSVTVEPSGNIFVGFEYTHRFEYTANLLHLINTKSPVVKQGVTVIDVTNPKSYEYEFIEVAPYTAGQESPYLKESVIDYYKRNNKFWKLKGVQENSMIVHVKGNNGDILPYLPQLLKLSCSFNTLPPYLHYVVSKSIKLSPEKKMRPLLQEAYKLLSQLSIVHFPKENCLVEKLGYDVKCANDPILKFGKNITHTNIYSGLPKGGIYSGKEAHVSFFVDPELRKSKEQDILKFIKLLKAEAENLGVNLIISKKPNRLREKLDYHIFSSTDITLQLKGLPKFFEGTVIVLTTENNSQNAYKPIKRELGGKQDIVTQFVIYDDSLLDIRKSRYNILNILLGIFVKSGIQPWILAENLNSDCFIGLDVSHEEGKHSSGIIQIIGRDGRMIKQKSMATNEAGERISWETIQDIIYECIHSYEMVYDSKPKHITFHRDGFCREDLDKINEVLLPMGIAFDYVEVLKNINRRMAIYENNQWTTHRGLYYQKGKEGFLCSTSPKDVVGMAKPIKIVQKTNCLSFDEIINDIYKLSFMHIHSMNKTRLPITTHYADLSSTFRNRGLIHPASKHEYSLPFV